MTVITEVDPHVAALNRIATALELLVGILDERGTKTGDALPPDELAPLPMTYGQNGYSAPVPVQNVPYAPNAYVPPVPASQWVCPIHGQVKTVPAGISKKTGQPYSSFPACPVQGCVQKPPR